MDVCIANASSHNVHVKVGCDIEYQQSANVGVDANAGAFGGIGVQVTKETQWKETSKVGFTKLNRYSSMEFHPDSQKKVCYVTIETRTDRGTISHCENHPLAKNRGLIIDSSLYIHNAKKGSTWTDIDGVKHRPDLENKGKLPKDYACSALNI